MNNITRIRNTGTTAVPPGSTLLDVEMSAQAAVSDLSQRTALVNHIFEVDRSLCTELEMQDWRLEMGKRLEGTQQEMLQALTSDMHIVAAFPGSLAERQQKLEPLMQAVVKVTQSGKGLSSWFTLYNNLTNLAPNSFHPRLIEAMLWRFANQAGDSGFSRLLHGFDRIQSSLRLYILQNRTSGQEQAIVQQSLAQTKSTLRIQSLGDQEAQLNDRLVQWLAQWARTPPSRPAQISAMYVLGFFTQVVAHHQLPSAQWERLLMTLELQHASRSSAKNTSDIFHAYEVLLSCVPLFGVIGAWLRQISTLPMGTQQLHMVALLQMAMAQRPQSALSQDWACSVDTAALHRAGWTGARVNLSSRQLLEDIRALVERHELDHVERAMARLAMWADARTGAQFCIEQSRSTLNILASSMVEGTADASSHSRVLRQIGALITVAVQAFAISDDRRVCESVLWRQVALHLNYSFDLSVWKQYKQVVAAFSQWDSASQPQIATTIRECSAVLEECIAMQMRVPVRWAKLQDPNALGHASSMVGQDAMIFATRFAVFQRLDGPERAMATMRNWVSNWLPGLNAPGEQRMLRDALHNLASHSAGAANHDFLLQSFQHWLQQLDTCVASFLVRREIDRVVDYVTQAGEQDYATRIRQGLVSEPPQGNHQAWLLGRLDCRWSLLRLCDVISRAPSEPNALFGWWWQTGVAKHIAAVPVAFIRTYLQHLSDALADFLNADGFKAIFPPILDQYKRTFALGSNEGQAELQYFCSTALTTHAWQRECQALANNPNYWGFVQTDAFLDSCPEKLRPWASEALRLHATQADAELAHMLIMPPTLALMQGMGEDAFEQSLLKWSCQAMQKLKIKDGLTLQLLIERWRQTGQQISVGMHLLDTAGKLSAELIRQGFEMPAKKEHTSHANALDWFQCQLGVILISQSQAHANLNALRLLSHVLFSQNAGQDTYRHAQLWFRLLLQLEQSALQSASSLRQQAVQLWFAPLLQCVERLSGFQALGQLAHSGADMALAERLQDELEWRVALDQLVCAASCKTIAAFDTQEILSAGITSSSAWVNETPESWNERSQALLSVLDAASDKSLRDDFAAVCAQMSLMLAERDRVRAARLSQPVNRYVAFRRNSYGLAMFKLCRLNATSDSPRDPATLETPVLSTLLGINNQQLEQQYAQVLQVLQYGWVDEVVRKKFLSNTSLRLPTPVFLATLKLIFSSCMQSIDGGFTKQSALHELARHCQATPSLAELLGLWLVQHQLALSAVPAWQQTCLDWSDRWLGLKIEQLVRGKPNPSTASYLTIRWLMHYLGSSAMTAAPWNHWLERWLRFGGIEETSRTAAMNALLNTIKTSSENFPLPLGSRTQALMPRGA